MRSKLLPTTVLALLLLPPSCVWAEAKPAPAAPAKADFRTDLIGNMEGAESKLLDLALAIPQEKYGWRPAPDVRSVSELFMHVVGGNYFIASFVGAQPPSGFTPDMEKSVTDKAKVIAAMKESFAHARSAASKVSDADLEKTRQLFGHETTYRSILLLLATHLHEHLGQSIAYARMNGVTPPWSEPKPKPAGATAPK